MTARATAARLVTSVPLLWVAIAAVTFLAIGLMFRRSAPTPLIPPATQAQIDRLEATRVRDSVSIATLVADAAHAQERGNSAVAHADVIVSRSRPDAHLADSLAAQARKTALAADSASMAARQWMQAYEARTREAEDLGKAVDTLLVAHRADSTAIALERGARLITAGRLVTSDSVIVELRATLKKAEKGCKVLWMKCPNRTTVFVVGGAIGAIGGAAAVVSLTR